MPSDSAPTKRFRIAFSFAGEKRDFVEKVADLLAARFGEDKILYDKFYEAKLAKAGLAFSLPDLYHNESDLIVTVLCPDYEKKEWCGLEWSAIYGLIKQGRVEQVMLTRFDRVEGTGLYGLAGFVELDHKTPEQTATLILQRLA
ncbi:MAG: TIR domain-containing protein, partial [Roseimicrobium sp.]